MKNITDDLNIDKEIEKTLHFNDYEKYANLCDENGREPEDIIAYEKGIDIIKFKKDKLEDINEYYKTHKYFQFVRENKKRNINPNDIFSNVLSKREILRDIMEYHGLKGRKESIENIPGKNIAKAYQSTYKAAIKHLEKKCNLS